MSNMRRATMDYGWLSSEAGRFQGVNLGYDLVGEQEGSVQELFHRFGLSAPAGPFRGMPATPAEKIGAVPAYV